MGHLCWQKAMNDVQFFYTQCAPRYDGLPLRSLVVIRSAQDAKEWLRSHKDTPLYKQQIELCDLAITNLNEELPSIERFHHVTDTERTDYIADIKKQMAVLQETKAPIMFHGRLLMEGSEFYNAKVAAQIRGQYQKDQEKKSKQ